MDAVLSNGLVRVRVCPPVVHPRHAREVLASPEAAALIPWTGGYAITVPEHRRLLEDLLAGFAWGHHGQAVLVHGLYGTGKSHLLVLLHLLLARAEAWAPFLDAHPTFRRYALAIQARKLLVVHGSLDEYGPRQSLEATLCAEIAHACAAAGVALPAEWPGEEARPPAWQALVETVQAAGYGGIVLLVDELSLFLAAKSPARREADAAFLQFLAGWTARSPVWLLGALQRNLADVGALRTHSWRQVEDRFRRYALSPQQIADVLRDNCLERTDPAAIRQLVSEHIAPAAAAEGLQLAVGDLHAHWPFHPLALEMLLAVVNGHLSPHRSAVEVLQRLDETGYLERSPGRLITPLELSSLIWDDLRSVGRLERLWRAVALLEGCADSPLGSALVRLLALLYLAERPATVGQLRALLFDGHSTPSIDTISTVLHDLRRRGAYLAVAREAEPAAETFCLAVDDEVSALALARMQEMRQEFTPHDPRVYDLALQAGTSEAWPLAACLHGTRLPVAWAGGTRAVQAATVQVLSPAVVTHAYEALLAGQADGHVLLAWPGCPPPSAWHTAAALLHGPHTGTLALWQPRAVRQSEFDLWAEYAAWQRAADGEELPAGPARRVRQRCTERAAELRPAVQSALATVYREGRWYTADGEEGEPSGETLVEVVSTLLDAGFTRLFPAYPVLARGGVPPRPAVQQLAQGVIEPGQAVLSPQSLLGDYIERFLMPLGCAVLDEGRVTITPPHPDLLEPLLAALTEPLRLHDAVALLGRPPLGLAAEQARLALLCAVRAGALRGLDGFLHPLDPESTPLARSDALVFLAAPTVVGESVRLLAQALATRWGIAPDPWPVACSQVERRLRRWVGEQQALLPALRQTLAHWSETLGVEPWGWRETETAFARLAALPTAPGTPLDDLLAGVDIALLERTEQAAAALQWWQAQAERLSILCALPWETTAHLRNTLAAGETAFAHLAEAQRALEELWPTYQRAYHDWHEATFGPAEVAELRATFDAADFRTVKLLTRLPVPLPASAVACLDALAQARTQFCPGIFTDGGCTRCRLPLGAPSPMPDPAQVATQAAHAVREYADPLHAHPWVATIRERLPRAPQEIAEGVERLLAWQPDHGAEPLLSLLTESLLAWLGREDAAVAATRHLGQLHARLTGKDLTLAETQQAWQAWINPDGTLGDDDVVRIL